MSTHTLPPDEAEQIQIQMEMEQARIQFERWRQIHRPRICRSHDEPSPYDGCRTVEDDRLDDPRHEP